MDCSSTATHTNTSYLHDEMLLISVTHSRIPKFSSILRLSRGSCYVHLDQKLSTINMYHIAQDLHLSQQGTSFQRSALFNNKKKRFELTEKLMSHSTYFRNKQENISLTNVWSDSLPVQETSMSCTVCGYKLGTMSPNTIRFLNFVHFLV